MTKAGRDWLESKLFLFNIKSNVFTVEPVWPRDHHKCGHLKIWVVGDSPLKTQYICTHFGALRKQEAVNYEYQIQFCSPRAGA